jgi:hypothetical protein
MRNYIRYVVCLVLPVLCVAHLDAQDIELKSVELRNDKLELHYDLLDSLEDRFYSIRLYSSADGFLNPLTKIKGDVGLEVKPGKDKVVSWAVREELAPDFNSKVSMEIRAKIFVPFINTESINQYKVYKRKRKYNLTWKGGTPQNILNFDLYHNEDKVTSFPNLANVGHHELELPSHIKPGKNYRFRISDVKNKDEVVYTNPFRIKRKVPLIMKVVPGLMVGSALYFLLSPKETESDLPVAPNELPSR